MTTNAITATAARLARVPTDLPDDAFGEMLTYLEAPDALNCSKVSRRWHANVAEHPDVWRVYCERAYPGAVRAELNSEAEYPIHWQRAYLLESATYRNITRSAYVKEFSSLFPPNAEMHRRYLRDNFLCYEVDVYDKQKRRICTDILFRPLPGGETHRIASISTQCPDASLSTQIRPPTFAGEIFLMRFLSKIVPIPVETFDDGTAAREMSFGVAVNQQGRQDNSNQTICSWDPKTRNFKILALVPNNTCSLGGAKEAFYIGSGTTLIKFDLSGKQVASFQHDSNIRQIVVEAEKVCVIDEDSKLLIFSQDDISTPLHVLGNYNEVTSLQVTGNTAFVGKHSHYRPANRGDDCITIWDIQNGERITTIKQPGDAVNQLLHLHKGMLFNLTAEGWLHIRDVRNVRAIRHIASIKAAFTHCADGYELSYIASQCCTNACELSYIGGKVYLNNLRLGLISLNFRPLLHTDNALVSRLTSLETELVRNETSAMRAFEALPEAQRNGIYRDVWALKGSPRDAHPEFGRLSFHQMEGLATEHHCTQDDRVAVVRKQKNRIQSTLIATVPTNDYQTRVIRHEEVQRVLSDTLLKQVIDVVAAYMSPNIDAEITGFSEAERTRLYDIAMQHKSIRRRHYYYPISETVPHLGQFSFHRSRKLPLNLRCNRKERGEVLKLFEVAENQRRIALRRLQLWQQAYRKFYALEGNAAIRLVTDLGKKLPFYKKAEKAFEKAFHLIPQLIKAPVPLTPSLRSLDAFYSKYSLDELGDELTRTAMATDTLRESPMQKVIEREKRVKALRKLQILQEFHNRMHKGSKRQELQGLENAIQVMMYAHVDSISLGNFEERYSQQSIEDIDRESERTIIGIREKFYALRCVALRKLQLAQEAFAKLQQGFGLKKPEMIQEGVEAVQKLQTLYANPVKAETPAESTSLNHYEQLNARLSLEEINNQFVQVVVQMDEFTKGLKSNQTNAAGSAGQRPSASTALQRAIEKRDMILKNYESAKARLRELRMMNIDVINATTATNVPLNLSEIKQLLAQAGLQKEINECERIINATAEIIRNMNFNQMTIDINACEQIINAIPEIIRTLAFNQTAAAGTAAARTNPPKATRVRSKCTIL